MDLLQAALDQGAAGSLGAYRAHFEKLKAYFEHQNQLLQGFEKDPEKLRENSAVLTDWADTLAFILRRI